MRAAESLLGIAFGLIMAMFVAVLGLLGWMTVQFLWHEHRWTLLVLSPVIALAVFVFAGRWKGGGLPKRGQHRSEVHRGISMHAIPVAGGMGLVFVLGYLWMFWFGIPGFRPVVLAAAVLGLALGFLLIQWRRWNS